MEFKNLDRVVHLNNELKERKKMLEGLSYFYEHDGTINLPNGKKINFIVTQSERDKYIELTEERIKKIKKELESL